VTACVGGFGFLLAACLIPAAMAAPAGSAATGIYRNLFQEYLGKSEAECNDKVLGAWKQINSGDRETQRLFYPLADGTTYVPDVINQDVRTEGLSYAMMIAVQLDQREIFDRVWKFAKLHMYHDDGPFRGYFAWHTALDGRQLDPGPAPDGEEWFTMALFFASHRWGDGQGIFDYGAQAQAILHSMLHQGEEAGSRATNMFDRPAHQVVFVPQGNGATFTDPSYHLPAFYELWARWATTVEDRTFLAEVARTSRTLFQRAADARTGLMPDYTTFSGEPYVQHGHEDFRYDAWRTLSNPSLDYAWWAIDPWQIEQANRVLTFFARQEAQGSSLFKIDGTPLATHGNSAGLIAMIGTAALGADEVHGKPAVTRLWNLKMPDGPGRYYDGLLTLLAWLEVSGRFRIYGSVAEKPTR
jgi:oligosaccharide reducing-end xylanase